MRSMPCLYKTTGSFSDAMMLMPANHSSSYFHWLCGKHPGKLGWLVGPSARAKTTLRPWVPFALDNDAFSAWRDKKPWDAEAWYQMLTWVGEAKLEPLWVLVPDVVADREATLKNWGIYAPLVAGIGWRKAFAAQDGMTPADVPSDADVVFVGGTYEWKWATVEMWSKSFPRVHVGRVNSIAKLHYCHSLGVTSCDGTSFFRSRNQRQDQNIEVWLDSLAETPNSEREIIPNINDPLPFPRA